MAKSAFAMEDLVLDGPGLAEFEAGVFEHERNLRFELLPEAVRKFDGQVAVVTGAAGGQGEMEAVSYTHLDVYKRQPSYRSSHLPCERSAWSRKRIRDQACRQEEDRYGYWRWTCWHGSSHRC